MSGKVDVVYVACNRLDYTRQTFNMLLENTEWVYVNRLVVYDDGSTDGTFEWLKEATDAARRSLKVIGVDFAATELGSPVAVMNEYLSRRPKPMVRKAHLWAKIDNDIAVPPDWLGELLGVMERNPELELLGMEAGMGGMLWPLTEDNRGRLVRGYLEASHIGGVGLMKRTAFEGRPRPVPNGRFGFTEWQHDNEIRAGWIVPDVLVSELSRIPVEPWVDLAERYIARGWQREQSKYDTLRPQYWTWWT